MAMCFIQAERLVEMAATLPSFALQSIHMARLAMYLVVSLNQQIQNRLLDSEIGLSQALDLREYVVSLLLLASTDITLQFNG